MTTPYHIIPVALQEGRKALFEHEAKDLVHSYGIIVPRYELADAADRNSVVAAGEKLGFPVVLKAVSSEILHKTETGAVMLNISTSAQLAASITAMTNMVAERAPDARIRFFLVEKMMPQGLELLIGGVRDPQFGPAVSVGLGGIWVEAIKDVAFGILPLNHEELIDMISKTKAAMFLKGFRGSPALDEEAVHLIITNLATLLDENPTIKEIDLNPVRVYARGAAALDARIVLQ